jgi:hypothetical protein
MTATVAPGALDVELDHRRRLTAAGLTPHVHAERAQEEVAKREEGHPVVPAWIAVEYWQEDDDTWSASAPLFGVTAVADSEATLFGQMAAAVEEYWDILNAQYDTLSDAMRGLLSLRYQGLRFDRRA